MDYAHLEATPRAREQGIDRLRRQAGYLLKFLDLNAPDTVLAYHLACLHDTASMALGVHYWAELGRRRMAVHRQHAALCQHCDNEVAAARSHPPVCERCDAKAEELAKQYGEGDDGEEG